MTSFHSSIQFPSAPTNTPPRFDPYGQYQPPQQQEQTPGLMDILGASLGQGVASGIQKQMKQSMLNKVLGSINPNMSSEDKLKLYSQADPETRQALKYYEDLRAQQFKQEQEQQKRNAVGAKQNRAQVDAERLFNQLSKSYLPDAVSDEDLEKKNAIQEYGSELMNQGVSPSEAFSRAKTFVKNKYSILDDLESIPDANPGIMKRLFGEKKSTTEKKIRDKVNRAKKSKYISEDEIAMKLLEKNYPPEFLDSLNLNLSDQFKDLLTGSSQQAPQQQTEMQQSVPQTPQVPQQQSQAPEGMPPAQEFSGKKIKDNQSGIVYQSDGTQWIRVQ